MTKIENRGCRASLCDHAAGEPALARNPFLPDIFFLTHSMPREVMSIKNNHKGSINPLGHPCVTWHNGTLASSETDIAGTASPVTTYCTTIAIICVSWEFRNLEAWTGWEMESGQHMGLGLFSTGRAFLLFLPWLRNLTWHIPTTSWISVDGDVRSRKRLATSAYRLEEEGEKKKEEITSAQRKSVFLCQIFKIKVQKKRTIQSFGGDSNRGYISFLPP